MRIKLADIPILLLAKENFWFLVIFWRKQKGLHFCFHIYSLSNPPLLKLQSPLISWNKKSLLLSRIFKSLARKNKETFYTPVVMLWIFSVHENLHLSKHNPSCTNTPSPMFLVILYQINWKFVILNNIL